MTHRLKAPRWMAVVLAGIAAACGAHGPATDTGGTSIVVHAGAADLDRQTLERWLLASPELPTPVVANRIVATWIDEALLATALERGPALDDSATADAVIMPDAASGELAAYWAARDARRPPPSAAEVDSLADLDRIRVFQQIVLKLPAESDSAAIKAFLARLTDLRLRALAVGSDFGALARQYSEDSASRANNGFLPPVNRDQLDSLMPGNRLWSIARGAVSPDAIRSESGLHMFRRATRAESFPYLRAWLAPVLARADNARFADSIGAARRMALVPGALARLRALAREPVVATGEEPLATWTGGALSPAAVRASLIMMTPDERSALTGASDTIAAIYLRQVARREIIIGIATPSGPVTPRARAALVPQYRVALDSLRAQRRLVSGTPGQAASDLLDSAVVRRRPLRVFPGMLVGVLRSRYPIRIDTTAVAGLVRSVADRWRAAHAGDSTLAGTPGLVPAPGSPPH